MEMIRRLLHQGFETCNSIAAQSEFFTDNGQGEIDGSKTTNDQYGYLDHIRIPDHFHTTEGDDQGKYGQPHHDHVQVFRSDQSADGNRTEIKNRRQVDKHIKQ